MLVLSRKQDQSISFPDLGIQVKVIAADRGKTRIGIEAPREIKVFRTELDEEKFEASKRSIQVSLPSNVRHDIRNRLNSLNIALHLLRAKLECGQSVDTNDVFDRLVNIVQGLGDHDALHKEKPASLKQNYEALLVEDEPNEREMLAGFLEMHGFTVTTAADGIDALQLLQEKLKPTVVLLDMKMPRCDGITTARSLRKIPGLESTKVFAISGSTPEDNNLDLSTSGINRWFHKPLNPMQLVQALATEISKSSIPAVAS